MSPFQKTFIMNIVGACGLLILGVVLLLNKLGEQSAGVLVAIVALYLTVALIPAGTARALTTASSRELRRSMLWANWVLIALWCLSVVGNLLAKQPFATVLAGALLFVLPQSINIKALREMLSANNQTVA